MLSSKAMNPRLAFAPALPFVLLWAGCSGVDHPDTASVPAPPPLLTPVEAEAMAKPAAPGVPAPPKPSLSRLTDRNRPKLDFFGATIYADSITGTVAKGNVYVDGSELHRLQRAFPIAVYAERISVDPIKGEAILSGWPIVQTDSAYVQGQSAETVIHISQNQMSAIDGPAKYVLGDKGADLFLP